MNIPMILDSQPIDPVGLLAKIRAQLNRKGAVRLSLYCNQIIAARMKGFSCEAIEKALIERGARIPARTLLRNLHPTGLAELIPMAVQIEETTGGGEQIGMVEKLRRQISIQDRRIELLLKKEEEKRRGNPDYIDKRIKWEMETMINMMRLMKEIQEVSPQKPEDSRLFDLPIEQEAEVLKLLGDRIIKGDINVTAIKVETIAPGN